MTQAGYPPKMLQEIMGHASISMTLHLYGHLYPGWLARQDPPPDIAALQAQLDHFAAYYNTARPHRATGHRWSGTKVLVLLRDLQIRIIAQRDGELIRELTLDPSRDLQARAQGVNYDWRHL